MSGEGADPGADATSTAGAQGQSQAQLEAENAALRARVAELEGRAGGAFQGAGARPLEEGLSSQRLLAAIVENSPSLIFVKDVEGRYLFINRQMERALGLLQEQVVGSIDLDIFPVEAADMMRAVDLESMSHGQTIQYEEVVRMPEGLRSFLTIKFPIHDAQGELVGICGIAADITEHRQAEAERAALQERMIDAQRSALQELSTPLVPIAEGVLAMPLVGAIDGPRAQQIMESLLDGIGRQGAHTAILDITGVRVVDTQVASGLVKAARAARLLGARVVLTGISASVAQTLVHLGADLGGIATLSTLQAGIAHALKR